MIDQGCAVALATDFNPGSCFTGSIPLLFALATLYMGLNTEEAVTMVACQVFGNDASIGFAASQGNFELNVFKPLIIYNFLQSSGLLADAMRSFNNNCIVGLEADRERIDQHLQNSLMLVTALNPHIGYDKAAKIAKTAYAQKISLKEAAIRLQLLSGEEFDRYVQAGDMVGKK